MVETRTRLNFNIFKGCYSGTQLTHKGYFNDENLSLEFANRWKVNGYYQVLDLGVCWRHFTISKTLQSSSKIAPSKGFLFLDRQSQQRNVTKINRQTFYCIQNFTKYTPLNASLTNPGYGLVNMLATTLSKSGLKTCKPETFSTPSTGEPAFFSLSC